MRTPLVAPVLPVFAELPTASFAAKGLLLAAAKPSAATCAPKA